MQVEAHRIKLVLESAGIKAGELHGNMQQAARLESLQRFKEGAVAVLVCTDVAARGLDIAGIEVRREGGREAAPSCSQPAALTALTLCTWPSLPHRLCPASAGLCCC